MDLIFGQSIHRPSLVGYVNNNSSQIQQVPTYHETTQIKSLDIFDIYITKSSSTKMDCVTSIVIGATVFMIMLW